MLKRVCKLAPPSGLKLGQQVEPAVVECTVAAPTERHDAVRVVAPAARARRQVGRVDAAGQAAGKAAASR